MRMYAAFRVLVGIVAVSGLIIPTNGFGTGAPISVCDNMTPGHRAPPQESQPPYQIIVPKNTAQGGETLRIRLAAPHFPFKGFLAMAVKVAYGDEIEGPPLLGEIVPAEHQARQVETVHCFGVDHSALTHKNPTPKNSIEFDWIAPNVDGHFVILATFVKDFHTYWVKVPSPEIKVTKRSFVPTHEHERLAPNQDLNPASFVFLELRTKFYAECGSTKGCFGVPQNCFLQQEGICEMFTSWRYVEGEGFKFQIAGKLPEWDNYEGASQLTQGHVSSGLSRDDRMGSDSVIGCVYKNGRVAPRSYFNYGYQNSVFQNESTGLEKIGLYGKYMNGYLMCEFTRSPVLRDTTHEIGATFDLVNDRFHIIMARATTLARNADNGREKLGYHATPEDKTVSFEQFSLTEGYGKWEGTRGGGDYRPAPAPGGYATPQIHEGAGGSSYGGPGFI